jgi:hypothetical protein
MTVHVDVIVDRENLLSVFFESGEACAHSSYLTQECYHPRGYFIFSQEFHHPRGSPASTGTAAPGNAQLSCAHETMTIRLQYNEQAHDTRHPQINHERTMLFHPP